MKEIREKIAELEKELNNYLFEDDEMCEKLEKKIEKLKYKLHLESLKNVQ